jgi:hypothetical protein
MTPPEESRADVVVAKDASRAKAGSLVRAGSLVKAARRVTAGSLVKPGSRVTAGSRVKPGSRVGKRATVVSRDESPARSGADEAIAEDGIVGGDRGRLTLRASHGSRGTIKRTRSNRGT